MIQIKRKITLDIQATMKDAWLEKHFYGKEPDKKQQLLREYSALLDSFESQLSGLVVAFITKNAFIDIDTKYEYPNELL